MFNVDTCMSATSLHTLFNMIKTCHSRIRITGMRFNKQFLAVENLVFTDTIMQTATITLQTHSLKSTHTGL